jgi:hypothetical protein
MLGSLGDAVVPTGLTTADGPRRNAKNRLTSSPIRDALASAQQPPSGAPAARLPISTARISYGVTPLTSRKSSVRPRAIAADRAS